MNSFSMGAIWGVSKKEKPIREQTGSNSVWLKFLDRVELKPSLTRSPCQELPVQASPSQFSTKKIVLFCFDQHIYFDDGRLPLVMVSWCWLCCLVEWVTWILPLRREFSQQMRRVLEQVRLSLHSPTLARIFPMNQESSGKLRLSLEGRLFHSQSTVFDQPNIFLVAKLNISDFSNA